MPFKPPVVDYRGIDPTPRPPRDWRPKSAGQFAAWICGLALLLLGCCVGLLQLGNRTATEIGAVLIPVALITWIVGSVISVIGAFEAKEVRSHARLGCSMALGFLVALFALWILGSY